MKYKKHIPNLITLLNLLCGCIALVFIADNQYQWCFLMVGAGIFLDFFDGFFARLFKVQSDLGLQLDSLADMVTSGVVPGFVMFEFLKNIGSDVSVFTWFPLVGFLITLGACYRLANFNIDTRQTDSFIGLPTPANALFILSIPLVVLNTSSQFIINVLSNPFVLLIISGVSAMVMNAEIRLFSLKIKNFSSKKNILPLFFLLSAIILLIVFKYLGVMLSIVFYVVLSVISNVRSKI